MEKDVKFFTLASEESIEKTVNALKNNGINAIVVDDGKSAKEELLKLIPSGAQVMNMTSMTLEKIEVVSEINEAGHFDSVRNKLNSMDKKNEADAMKKLGSAPQYAIGSVHAVTEDGKTLIASATGSQLPAYAYGSERVIWVVGSQKIVKDLDEGMMRIYEYVFPLENERAMNAYGMGSGVNKMLIINKEVDPERITMIIVKENLGF